MAVNTVLFDLDGTLADTLPLIKETYARVFKRMGIPWGNDDVMNMIGLPLREIGGIMAGAGREEEFYQIYQQEYRLLHHNFIGLYPGIKEVLLKLREESFALGVVTSKGRAGADLTLSSIDIGSFFTVLITVDDTEKHKPNPDPVLLALEKLNKQPDEAVFVGDSPFDIMAGNRAGVATIGVSWGMAAVDELQKHNPCYCVGSREELLELILSLRFQKS